MDRQELVPHILVDQSVVDNMLVEKEDTYLEEWYKLHYQMSKQGFNWGMVPEKDIYKQYMTTTIHNVSSKLWNDIQEATIKVGSIYNKLYHHIMNNKEMLDQLGMNESLKIACSNSKEEDLFSLITRFDFIVNHGQIKLCEANTATPQGLPESHIANNILCDYYSEKSPNKIKQHLSLMWDEYFRSHSYIDKNEPLYCTTYKWFSEDYNTSTFIANTCDDGREIKFIPIEHIRVSENGVYDEVGNQIKLMYMLYPMEFLPHDTDTKGRRIGAMLLDHIAKGKIHVINPMSATIMQSKMILAMVWELHENKSNVFLESEHEDIEKYFLPTYVFNKDKLDKYRDQFNSKIVVKPIFGREGKGVRIIDSLGKEYMIKSDEWYTDQPCIVQQYLELPNQSVDTWGGKEKGKMMTGSYLIGGRPSGLYLRVDKEITGENCYLVGVSKDE